MLLYGSSFFCVKFAVYSLLLWMPLFLAEELGYKNSEIANVQSLYEIGTVTGAIILGFLSDKFYSRRSPIGILSVIVSTFIGYTVTFNYHTMKSSAFATCMFFLGFFIGSLHHLICMTAAADLGRQQKGKRATSTITGIIDGIGTSGSGLGQLLLGTTIQLFGWRHGFMLPISIVIMLTVIPMGKIFYREIYEILEIRR